MTSDSELCSISQTLDIVGDRWTLLILRDIFRGSHRFSEIQSGLGVARNLLTERLGRLVDADVLVKVSYQDRPPRYEYRLTEKGASLSPALIALMHWGDRWFNSENPPTTLVHDACGTPLEQHLLCPCCDVDVLPSSIRSRKEEYS
ncbi:MAG: helix-turn-helix transcriptional regulator [Acidobacteria bacterium]|nr:helix-turn-helix transcriptional regulator [Acidobacteriota bacterium]